MKSINLFSNLAFLKGTSTTGKTNVAPVSFKQKLEDLNKNKEKRQTVLRQREIDDNNEDFIKMETTQLT